jgi:hypothetical protein
VPGTTEAWTLTCQRPGRSGVSAQQVTVARGETVDLGQVCSTKWERRR